MRSSAENTALGKSELPERGAVNILLDSDREKAA